MTTLYVRDGDGFRAADTRDVIDRAQALIAQRYRTGAPVFRSPDRTREFLTLKLGGLEYEMFAVLALDNRHRLIEYIELFRGTVDNTTIHPREVVKELLRVNAAAAIFAHNHPSGVAEPSEADQLITRRLRQALELVDIRVLDHFVVGQTMTSMASRGLL
jgi:DNA repair protein RadC